MKVKTKFRASIFVAAAAISVPGIAAAQSAPGGVAEPSGGGLDEIIVTAQKRDQNLQQTPISMAAFQAEALEERGVTNIGQLASAVPNLAIKPFGSSPTTLRLFIRGVGANDSQITQDPPVGIYLNGVYIARPVGLSLDIPDIERIEVLRGPQGTLYGRNTTGGAINIITQKPDDQLSGSQLLGFGNYGAVHSQTVVNIPVADGFYVKGAFDWNRRDGWLKNTGEGPDFSGFNRRSVRFDARWLPTDNFTIDYSFDRSVSSYTPDYYHLSEVSPGFTGVLEAQPRRLKRAALPTPLLKSRDRASGHALTLTLDTGLGELKSISAYRKLWTDSYQDFSGNPDLSIYTSGFKLAQNQFSQELQLVGGNASKSLEYAVGAYYFRERGRDEGLATIAIADVVVPTRNLARNSTYAIYGQVTWSPASLPGCSITAGGRYTWDKREATNYVVPLAKLRSENFSPSLVINYEASPNANIYAKVATGYKAGGFNVRQADFNQGFEPEKLTTYEFGWKTEWLGRRLRWNTAIFYSDYRDIQLDILVPDQPDPTLTVTSNAGKAKIAGIETDLDIAITDTFRTKVSYSYLYNKITKVEGDDASLWQLPNAPKHSVTASADWDIAETPIGVINAVADFSWRSRAVTSSRFVAGADVPAYALLDLRLSLKGEDWFGTGNSSRISLWVRNVTDKAYFNDTFGSFAGLHAAKVTTYGAPRTFGIDFKTGF